MKSELAPVTARWKYIGLALRLNPSKLKRIERENRDNLEDCLTEVLTLWLNGTYNTERFGEPSWELLARAVAHPAGGNNPALAEEIAKKDGGIIHESDYPQAIGHGSSASHEDPRRPFTSFLSQYYRCFFILYT